MSTSSSSHHSPGRQHPSPTLQVAVRTADGGELIIGSKRAGSSKTRILDFKAPILDACGVGDAASLRTMYNEGKYANDRSKTSSPSNEEDKILATTSFPTADEMILAAIEQGRFLILETISELCPNHQWAASTFEQGLKCDMEARGNHYLLAFCRWTRDPLQLYGELGDALMWAVLLGDLETAVTLLSWGADPNGCKWKNMYSHLHIATSMYGTSRPRSPPMVNLLIRYGANIHSQGLLSWIVGTISSPRPKTQEIVYAETILGQLLHEGVQVDEIPPIFDDDCPPAVHEVPLIAAILTGPSCLVAFLLAHGAHTSVRDRNGAKTAFEHACNMDRMDTRPGLISTFVRHGVSPATLWGILESDLAPQEADLCRCRKRSALDVELRYLPTLKPEI